MDRHEMEKLTTKTKKKRRLERHEVDGIILYLRREAERRQKACMENKDDYSKGAYLAYCWIASELKKIM